MQEKVLIYTVHKAASMFLHRVTSEVADELDIDYYSINDDAHHNAIRQESWKAFIENEDRTGCFGPIRAGTADPAIPEPLAAYRAVLHLRDPRDVLTSLFFSHAYSHARGAGRFNPSDEQRDEWQQAGIDEYVQNRAPEILGRYQQLCDQLLGRDNVLFVKYEDLIADYGSWLQQFLAAFSAVPPPTRKWLGLVAYQNTPSRIHRKLYRKHKHEFSVSAEDVKQHKRQVIPGDHRRKLAGPTIENLNEQFHAVLTTLGYDVE